VVFRESKELWGLNFAPDYHVEIIGGEWTQLSLTVFYNANTQKLFSISSKTHFQPKV